MPTQQVDASAGRTRGRSRQANWQRPDQLAVITLELDVSADPRTRARVEKHFAAVHRLRRAVQRDARTAARAYLAAHRERQADPAWLRKRLGLSRKAIEARASKHVDASRWMRAHFTKATALHVADEV